ncbi:MAG TPA: hypothetical protein VMS08_03605 [Candidatus Saccharimonadia bacterium]|nr:hypothetical protein [Candidatus Saccharimonadia bacterium]
MSQPINELLAERRSTHGDFTHHAQCTQDMMDLFARQSNWSSLTAVQKEFLHMNAHKCARILTGDPNHADHYDDIAGYAKLVSDRLPNLKPAPIAGLAELESAIRDKVIETFAPGSPENGGHHEGNKTDNDDDEESSPLSDGMLQPPQWKYIVVKTDTTIYYNVNRAYYAEAAVEHLLKLAAVINSYEFNQVALQYKGMYERTDMDGWALKPEYVEHWAK